MTVADYDAARSLVPEVSRCNRWLTKDEFAPLLNIPTFHPYCCYRLDTNELVGYAELHRMPHLGRKFDARVERVVISPNFRDKGLASAMCTELIRRAKDELDCGRVELTVEKPAARHIYEEKLHFKPVDTTVMRLLFQEL